MRKGLSASEAILFANAIGKEKNDPTTPLNAQCDKCGGPLRATPAILAAIKLGVVDHKGCGGTFRAAKEGDTNG